MRPVAAEFGTSGVEEGDKGLRGTKALKAAHRLVLPQDHALCYCTSIVTHTYTVFQHTSDHAVMQSTRPTRNKRPPSYLNQFQTENDTELAASSPQPSLAASGLPTGKPARARPRRASDSKPDNDQDSSESDCSEPAGSDSAEGDSSDEGDDAPRQRKKRCTAAAGEARRVTG